MAADGDQKALGEAANRRPEDVRDLLLDRQTSDSWYGQHRKLNRFYVANIGPVITGLGIDHTTSGPYFADAAKAIAAETQWTQQSGFEFSSSKTQIYPKDRGKPKRFGHAATIIVGLELYARKNRPEFNVYEHLRILPAQFFIDRLDVRRLKALGDYYAALDEDARKTAFGADAPETFAEAAILALRQHEVKLLDEMVAGHCVTQFVADGLMNFVNGKFPSALHLGPVRSTGDEPFDTQLLLGSRAAASTMRVPYSFDPKTLAPIYPGDADAIQLDGDGANSVAGKDEPKPT